jgi:beta-galactosidase GanA
MKNKYLLTELSIYYVGLSVLIVFFLFDVKLVAQSTPKSLYVGVSYYPKISGDKIDSDIQKMKEIGINQVRLGDFDWISEEPKEGVYNFEWLEKAIDKFTKAGIAVELCTPTAAPPIWLEEKHPEIFPVNASGLVVGHGGRRQYSPNSKVYREYCRKIVEKLGQKFGKNPDIITWQIDNELWGDDYSHASLMAFHIWLKKKYGTIENLNNLWCTELWSQKYQRFDQVPLPDPYRVGAGQHPSLFLVYRRFMSDSYISFCNEQVSILRKYTNAQITTNCHNPLFQEIDCEKLFKNLDVVCYDSYAGPKELYRYTFQADWMRGLGKPFWLAETEVSVSGGTSVSNINDFADYKGSLRAKMWLNYALGGDLVSFWLWRQHWAGQELEHSGLLYSWGEENINTPEIQEVAKELNHYGDWLRSTNPKKATTALYYEIPMQWIFEATPMAEGFQYDEAIASYYKMLIDAGLNRDVIMGNADLNNYKTLFSPYMPAFEKGQLKKIEAFVENGGTWVLGPLSACRTLEATAHKEACYGNDFESWLGIHVRHRLPPSNETRIVSENDTAKCSYWCDAYEVKNNQKIIAKYENGVLDGMPAIVECKIGKGRVFVMGTKPEDSWMVRFVQKITEGDFYSEDPGVFVIERVDKENELAGIIAVNTNQHKAKYIYDGETHLIDSYGVDVILQIKNIHNKINMISEKNPIKCMQAISSFF